MLAAKDVARYFLGTFDAESGDNITNLKLQKLLYYAQGFHLAMQAGRPLFADPLEAWEHGPVVRSVYHEYKGYGWRAIEPPDDFDPDDYLPEVREILDAVDRVYGPFTAKHLEWLTHMEPPWADTPRDQAISPASIRDYFTSLVDEGRAGTAPPYHPIWPSNGFRFQRRPSLAERLSPRRDRLRTITRRVADTPDPWAGDDD